MNHSIALKDHIIFITCSSIYAQKNSIYSIFFLIWYLLTILYTIYLLYQWALDIHIQGFWIRNMQFCKGVIYTDYLKMHKKRYVFSWLMILVCGFSKIILNANIQLLPFRFQCITVKTVAYVWMTRYYYIIIMPFKKVGFSNYDLWQSVLFESMRDCYFLAVV